MRTQWAAVTTLLCGLPLPVSFAQTVDPKLAQEVSAVRADLARSATALLRYSWTEETEVLVSGKVKSSTAAICRYDEKGKIVRSEAGEPKDKPTSRQTSNRPSVRASGDMRDYIERAQSRIREYAPPNPEQIDHLLRNGEASLGASSGGKSEVRFVHYFLEGDSMVFTYDSGSKRLLRVFVTTNLSNAKDPVTLEATFERLPDGVNHLSSATLKASARKVQVNVRNVIYLKLTD